MNGRTSARSPSGSCRCSWGPGSPGQCRRKRVAWKQCGSARAKCKRGSIGNRFLTMTGDNGAKERRVTNVSMARHDGRWRRGGGHAAWLRPAGAGRGAGAGAVRGRPCRGAFVGRMVARGGDAGPAVRDDGIAGAGVRAGARDGRGAERGQCARVARHRRRAAGRGWAQRRADGGHGARRIAARGARTRAGRARRAAEWR